MWVCPRCKESIRVLDVRTSVVVFQDGVEVNGDVSWADENRAECTACAWTGTAGEAWVEVEKGQPTY
jgi:hypothetical protein